MTTEQNSTPNDPQPTAPVVSPGQLLQAAREKMGWSREQVATRLHLRMTLVTNIESDTYDKHTSATFIRGYLRSYAKLVGIEEKTILEAYDSLGLHTPQNINMQSFSRRTRREASNTRLKLVSWLIILVLIALLVAWWWQDSSRREAGQDELAASEMPAQVSLTQSEAQPEVVTDAQPLVQAEMPAPVELAPVQESVSAAQGTVVSAAATTEVVVESAPETPAAEAAPAPQLKLGFTADCWFEVRDADGKVLFSGLKKANDELTLEGKEPLRLHIGAPMAVRVNYKGQEIDMSRYNNGRTARMTLPQE